MRQRTLIAAVAVATLCPALARGVDGVLEISPACAVSGCFPGDLPGYPISITQTGSYRLVGNLDVPSPVTAIEIDAANVSLDLNGFTLSGAAGCPGDPPAGCTATTGVGVHANAPATRVGSGFVRGFGDGGLVLGQAGEVERVDASRNGRVGIEVGAQGRIRGSRAGSNHGVGLSAGADGSIRDSSSLWNSGTAVVLGAGAVLADSSLTGEGVLVTGGVLLGGNVCNRATSCERQCTDADGDGFFADCLPLDCDDQQALRFPGNPELCDGIDNDCNGLVDDACGGGLGEGEVCTADPGGCAPGLLCCYPCGIPDCDFTCMQPVAGGCPLFP